MVFIYMAFLIEIVLDVFISECLRPILPRVKKLSYLSFDGRMNDVNKVTNKIKIIGSSFSSQTILKDLSPILEALQLQNKQI